MRRPWKSTGFAGSTIAPDESFMAKVARNLTDAVDGFLLRHRYLISDRDSKFTTQDFCDESSTAEVANPNVTRMVANAYRP